MRGVKHRALLIGIDDYAVRPLAGCVNDIDLIERVLLDRVGVQPEDVIRLASPRVGSVSSTRLPSVGATLFNIWNALEGVAERVGEGDRVLIYYSGHGTQTRSHSAHGTFVHEALVAADHDPELGLARLLHDFELNSLLTRLAARAANVTIVLDCCHSAGATRALEDDDRNVRCLPDDGVVYPRELEAWELSSSRAPRSPFLTLAACTAGERAREIAGDSGRRQGAFTLALAEQLRRIDGERLDELRWAEIWPAIVDGVSGRSANQHPRLIGRSERRVFGGPWQPRDAGFVVRAESDYFRIQAGTVVGLSVGAELAVYGPEPAAFPPLGSAEDLRARVGKLRVVEAGRSSATAMPLGAPFVLPVEARARLIVGGKSDRLVVSVEPFDAHLAARLDVADAIELVPSGSPRAEARLCQDGRRYGFGDDVYGDGAEADRPPLFRAATGELETLRDLLLHYARYNDVLRLPKRCTDLRDALHVSLRDCDDAKRLVSAWSEKPDLPELTRGARFDYSVAAQRGFCIRIDNSSDAVLFATVLNCAASGRVEVLGEVELPARGYQLLWRRGEVGSPFFGVASGPAAANGARFSIDRLIVVATSRPELDLKRLALAASFEQVRSNRARGTKSRELDDAPFSPLTESWTAVQLTIELEAAQNTRGLARDAVAASDAGRAARSTSRPPRPPRKIAVLGGGMASLAAVFELTHQAGWQEHYEITVYQQGFRLGGKGASGRNRELGDRIEEHGLHIWMGFYENAFRLIRDCYSDARRPVGAIAAFDQAFRPHSRIVLEEKIGGEWRHWPIDFPTNDQRPGDAERLPSAREYVEMLFGWMDAALRSTSADRELRDTSEELDQLDRALSAYRRGLETLDRDGARDASLDLRGVAREISEHLAQMIGAVRKRALGSDDLRRVLLLLDLAATNVRGVVADGLVLGKDFTSIDHLDYAQWLAIHGAAQSTIDSAPVRALYNLVFSVERGIAAGTTLICLLRLVFTYRGAIFYKMQAGMGDIVFAPLYQVLRARGVKFQFFTRVDNLSLSKDRCSIDAIEVARQARLAPGVATYEPLYDVEGLACWPSQPLWEQLADGPRLQAEQRDFEDFYALRTDESAQRLRRGVDFDLVVLGIPVGAHSHVCPELMDANPRFGDMVRGIATCRTQAVQLWFDKSLSELGWDGASPVQGAYEEPYDTWADMTHLLARESWRAAADRQPRSLAYLCGYLDDATPEPTRPDRAFSAGEQRRAKRLAADWLKRYAAHLWPRAEARVAGEVLAAHVLFDPRGAAGAARFDAQYFRANVSPSERYVLSVPGSTRFRLRADESGFSNLYLAGDWLRTGLDGGCIEAATMGGLQACKAIWRDLGFVPDSPRPIVGGFEPALLSPARQQAKPTLPRFVERGGDVVFHHPYFQTGTKLYAFTLKSSYEALTALCDRHLNVAGGPVYEPLAPLVTLICADIARTGSCAPGDREKGWMAERDVSFWIPVVAGRRLGGVFLPEAARLSWFLPYIWVDNAIAMTAGREVFGFPKQASRIELSTVNPGCFSVEAAALQRFGVDSAVEPARLIQVVGRSASKAGQLRAGSDVGALRALVTGKEGSMFSGLRGGLARFASTVLGDLAGNSVPLVFLKQFRDVVDPSRACYQAIVEADASWSRVRDGGLLEAADYRVEIAGYDSHPLIGDLGLDPARAADLTPTHAFWLDFDFTMNLGRVVHTSSP